MALTLPSSTPAAGGSTDILNHAPDDLDDLFALPADDVLAKTTTDQHAKAAPKQKTTKLGLGFDEEVEVARKPRAPRVKLDEERLLSTKGLPELRKRAKGFKSRGRGYEV